MGGTLVGGFTVADHRSDLAHSFEQLARRTVDDAADHVTMPPVRATHLLGVTDGRTVQGLELTLQPRGGQPSSVADLLLTVRTHDVLVHVRMDDPAVAVHTLRDADRSLRNGTFDDTDLVEVDLDLEAVGATLGPRTATELVLDAPHALPLRLAFEVPPTLDPLVDLDPYERI